MMKKVLVVEDEKNIALTLKMSLESEGYTVKIATNGLDAIQVAQEYKPELMFLDIILPKVNGYLVCEALRQEIDTKNIPVIFMSAKNQEEDIKKAYEIGGDEYLIKPFSCEQIKELTKKYLKED